MKHKSDIGAPSEEHDVLAGEIAILINEKPLTVIQTISAAGYDFKGETRMDLIKAVGQLIKESPRFATMMAGLIAMNNGMITYEQVSSLGQKYMGDTGKVDMWLNAGGGGMDWISAAIGAVGDITSYSLNLANAKTTAKATTAVAEKGYEAAQANANATLGAAKEQTKIALLGLMGNKGGSGISGGMLFGGFVGIVVIIAAIMLLSKKSGSSSVSSPLQQPGQDSNVGSPAVIGESSATPGGQPGSAHVG